MKRIFQLFIFGIGLFMASCADDFNEDIQVSPIPDLQTGEDEDDPIIIEGD